MSVSRFIHFSGRGPVIPAPMYFFSFNFRSKMVSLKSPKEKLLNSLSFNVSG